MVRVPPRMMIAGLFALIIAASMSVSAILSDPGSLSRLPKVNALLILVRAGFPGHPAHANGVGVDWGNSRAFHLGSSQPGRNPG